MTAISVTKVHDVVCDLVQLNASYHEDKANMADQILVRSCDRLSKGRGSRIAYSRALGSTASSLHDRLCPRAFQLVRV